MNLIPRIGILTISCFVLFGALPRAAWPWGGVGHRMVAETAAILLQQESPQGWGDFFARHRFELGHYSFLPDSAFRHNDGNKGNSEAPTHFFDLDLVFGVKEFKPSLRKEVAAFPTEIASARQYLNKKFGDKLPQVGSAPWRVEQLTAMAKDELKDVKKLGGGYQRGKVAEGDIHHAWMALYYLGVMAHYTGDAAMPYHATSDFNGFAQKLGGIHFYFEADCVHALAPEIDKEVLALASKHQKEWIEQWKLGKKDAEPARIMMGLLFDSGLRIEALAELDRKHAVTKLSDPAKKNFALRKPASEGCQPMRALLIESLAKGAVATKHIWQLTLPKSVHFDSTKRLQFSDMNEDVRFIPATYMDGK